MYCAEEWKVHPALTGIQQWKYYWWCYRGLCCEFRDQWS